MKTLLIVFCLLLFATSAVAQSCNPNIDFEDGTFNNWECSSGTIDKNGVIMMSAVGAIPNRHTMLPSKSPAAQDEYGEFSLNSPNGSKYCVRLGNNINGGEAERISYTFTVPATANDYSIVFNYAVVFENPGHQAYQQPRFTSRIFDVTANQYIDCGSFDFAASSGLPGFLLSKRKGTAEVYYKPWSSVTVKLPGYQGKQIRLEFTTNDCTLGGHFGYAYIDVINNCNAALISGNVSCAGDDSITLNAPAGFDGYNWYNADFSQLLGTGKSLTLSPLPAEGTVYALQLSPFASLGCTDTVYTTIKRSSDPFKFGVQDSIAGCQPQGVELISALMPGNTPGLLYNYLDSTKETAVIPDYGISMTGKYFIKATNAAGCTATKPVKVIAWPIPVFTVTNPKPVTAPTTINLSTTVNDPSLIFSYWKDDKATQPVSNPQAVENSGTYFIKSLDSNGCVYIEPVVVTIGAIMQMPSAFSPNGDGKNDVFKLAARGGIASIPYFKIFDRWGKLVFSTTDPQKAWDGTLNGHPQDNGIYIWMIKAVDYAGTVFESKGTVTLLR
ncbi:MAG: gliding motility-associated C-terminal domain-containing protein [Chitinophagaceae bacterium]